MQQGVTSINATQALRLQKHDGKCKEGDPILFHHEMKFPPHTVFVTMRLPKAQNNKNPNQTEANDCLRGQLVNKQFLAAGTSEDNAQG